MTASPRPRYKVIGVGNDWRGDDAAGLLVVRRLREDRLPQVEIAECRGTVDALREAWKDAAGVMVVDAVAAGGLPGTIYRLDAHRAGGPVRLSRSSSTHGWGLSEALTLGRVFQDLPPWLIIYGIEGRNFELGEHLSPEVAAAIPEAARRLKLEILAWLGREDPETISLE